MFSIEIFATIMFATICSALRELHSGMTRSSLSLLLWFGLVSTRTSCVSVLVYSYTLRPYVVYSYLNSYADHAARAGHPAIADARVRQRERPDRAGPQPRRGSARQAAENAAQVGRLLQLRSFFCWPLLLFLSSNPALACWYSYLQVILPLILTV